MFQYIFEYSNLFSSVLLILPAIIKGGKTFSVGTYNNVVEQTQALASKLESDTTMGTSSGGPIQTFSRFQARRQIFNCIDEKTN